MKSHDFHSSTDAKEDRTPFIGVHTLSEFAFCPRAGLISHGFWKDCPTSDIAPSNLDFLPFYEIRQIDEHLDRIYLRLKASLVMEFACGIGVWVSYGRASSLAFFGFALLATFVAVFAIGLFWQAWKAVAQRAEFLDAEARLPNLNSSRSEYINWRGLIRYGFDLNVPDGDFIDLDSRLRGRPKKLLRRGELCIPVFFQEKRPSPRFKNMEPESFLYPQHIIRIAAYCMLIEANTPYSSPFGIIVTLGDYNSIAVKYGSEAKRLLAGCLAKAHLFLDKPFAENISELKPGFGNVCLNCPLGHPAIASANPSTFIFGKEILPKLHSIGTDFVHSICGDVFDWTPPHRDSISLRLPT